MNALIRHPDTVLGTHRLLPTACRRGWTTAKYALGADRAAGPWQPCRPCHRACGRLWVPEALQTSCALLIFVEEAAADAVASSDGVDLGWSAVGEWA